jgi:hypothetical protein
MVVIILSETAGMVFISHRKLYCYGLGKGSADGAAKLGRATIVSL